jgi:hypothetical protein
MNSKDTKSQGLCSPQLQVQMEIDGADRSKTNLEAGPGLDSNWEECILGRVQSSERAASTSDSKSEQSRSEVHLLHRKGITSV